MRGRKVEIDDVDSFIERTADAVVKRIDEREKINIIAGGVMDSVREVESRETTVGVALQ